MISWGIKITALYLGFVALIVTLVIISMNQKVDLVSKDYYQQEIKFQERIDATQNASETVKQITFSNVDKKIIFDYEPDILSKDFSGEIVFFRPSDADKDVKVKMNPDVDGIQIIDASSFMHGMYKVQISWNNYGKKYYKEDVLFIK
jgi:hypothetical protein